MIRKIALAGAAGAIALAGLAATIGSASAAPPVITDATAANIQCDLAPGKAKTAPALKNNWIASQHASDPEPVVVALPDTKFNTDGPNTVSSKSKTAVCTGTVSDASGTYPVSSLKIELTSLGGTPAVDNPPLQDDNTCSGLLAGTQPEDDAATYVAIIQAKLTGAKMGPSTTTGLGIVAGEGGAIGFGLGGGTTTGPLAGADSQTTAYIDGTVLAAVTAAPPTSAAPAPAKGTGDRCQPTLKLKSKLGVVVSASLKPPKGLKKIIVGPNILNPSQQSNICVKIGSTC